MSQDSSSTRSDSESSYNYRRESDSNFDSDDFLLLQHQDETQEYSLYNQEPILCPICCETVEEGLAIVLPSCGHSFCTTCFFMYLNARIGEGDADVICCPCFPTEAGRHEQQCKALIRDEVLKELFDSDSYQELMDQKSHAFVRKNVDYHHCPTPDCTNIVLCKNVEKMSIGNCSNNEAGISRICDCFKCGRTSCLLCGASPFHTNKSCEKYREECEREEEERLKSCEKYREECEREEEEHHKSCEKYREECEREDEERHQKSEAMRAMRGQHRDEVHRILFKAAQDIRDKKWSYV